MSNTEAKKRAQAAWVERANVHFQRVNIFIPKSKVAEYKARAYADRQALRATIK